MSELLGYIVSGLVFTYTFWLMLLAAVIGGSLFGTVGCFAGSAIGLLVGAYIHVSRHPEAKKLHARIIIAAAGVAAMTLIALFRVQ